MAAPPPFTEREEAFLRALVDEGVDFLVVDLAAAALQGVPAVTQDVALWIRDLSDERLQAALAHVGATYVPPGPDHPPLLVGAGVELFDVVVHMHGLESFAQEARRAERVPIGDVEIPVLRLDRIIASKEATDRPKDRAILPALRDAWKVRRARKGRGR